jgi:hypothetical protein
MKTRTSLLAPLLAAALAGCNSVPTQVNLLKSVELAPAQTPALDTRLAFLVKGSGACGKVTIDWGDDSSTTDVFGGAQSTDCVPDTDPAGVKGFKCNASHVYSGWGGGKTVTATAVSGCEGRVNLRFVIEPSIYHLPLSRPGPDRCHTISNRPSLAMRSLVKITTVPPARLRCPGIIEPDGHCYDAEGGGVPQVIDPAPVFPFPGMRAYSLVLRVGTQVVQGGTNMSFTTPQGGPLEVCVNEVDPQGGNGGYEVDIRVDQLGPPPPP